MEPAKARAWRKRANKTQAEVAASLGITRGTYAVWEQGRTVLGKKTSAKLQQLINPAEPKPVVVRKTALPTTINRFVSQQTHDTTALILSAYMKSNPVLPTDYARLYAGVVNALNP